MLPVGFEPTISAGERPQTYALDGAATGTGNILYIYCTIQARMLHVLSCKLGSWLVGLWDYSAETGAVSLVEKNPAIIFFYVTGQLSQNLLTPGNNKKFIYKHIIYVTCVF